MNLPLDGTHALVDLRLSLQCFRLKGPIKAVLHGHKVQQQFANEGLGFVDSILGGSLPIVFELGQRLRAERFLLVKRRFQFLQLVSMRLSSKRITVGMENGLQACGFFAWHTFFRREGFQFVGVPYLIKSRNSLRVLLSLLKRPSMQLVIVLLFCFWTPRIIMQR